LRDIAGMIRSFHYATYSALSQQQERGAAEPGSADHAALVQAGAYWYAWVTATYLKAYNEAAKDSDFLPSDEQYATLLEVYLLDKAAYEVSYELDNRPDWLHVPLMGIRDLLVAGGLL
jgi:predicted trehalose synthase